jgi:hypothetical protein
MDDRLKQALDFSNYNQTLSIQRKLLKEKIAANLTYGYNGGIFRIDQSLIGFVQMLIDRERTTDVPLLDLNNNPILVSNMIEFRDEILDRYFTSVYQYLEEYETLKKSRSVEKLIGYE